MAEVFTYLDACGKHVYRINSFSTMEKIRNPISIAQKVQAYLLGRESVEERGVFWPFRYSSFALTARICGNKGKSLVYMDQARMFARQIFDNADPDTGTPLLLYSSFAQGAHAQTKLRCLLGKFLISR
jgi:hypothetical protein